MSRNWIPGFGKSGIVRTSAARSRSGRGGSAIMAPPFPSVRSMLLVGPDVPVRQIGENAEDAQEQEGGPAHQHPLHQLGLRGPPKESRDVARHRLHKIGKASGREKVWRAGEI